jgi:large subunit ribosomal protein L13
MSSHLLPNQRTKYVRNEDIKKNWILIDAKDQILGRLASRIAYRARGKHRTDFSFHQDVGDHIVVINARHLKVTGQKMQQKLYYEHSNYPGGMKITALKDKMSKDPIYALKKAVQRMLPKGALGRKLLGHVKVYADAEHMHKSQNPTPVDPASIHV